MKRDMGLRPGCNARKSPAIRTYLSNFRECYPGILDWFSGLEQGIASGGRRVFVSWRGREIQGLAVAKLGVRAKLCHISVVNSARAGGVGTALACLALRDMVRHGAREIRVTTGERVFREHGTFFRSLGFEVVDWQVHRYRRGAAELLWRQDVDPAWSGAQTQRHLNAARMHQTYSSIGENR